MVISVLGTTYLVPGKGEVRFGSGRLLGDGREGTRVNSLVVRFWVEMYEVVGADRQPRRRRKYPEKRKR